MFGKLQLYWLFYSLISTTLILLDLYFLYTKLSTQRLLYSRSWARGCHLQVTCQAYNALILRHTVFRCLVLWVKYEVTRTLWPILQANVSQRLHNNIYIWAMLSLARKISKFEYDHLSLKSILKTTHIRCSPSWESLAYHAHRYRVGRYGNEN